MILLVPIAPEVPKFHWPKLWPGLVMVLVVGIIFLETDAIVRSDTSYIESLQTFVVNDNDGHPALKPEIQTYLKLRPLLRIAPSKGDWDIPRLLFANFLHGGTFHLLLNLIGLFAGARICYTFVPFLVSVCIFVIGGSLGLLVSILLTSELSAFVPHIGASAGIFALMGTYYVYNFGYRTKYFYWLPGNQGLISLKTSWAFFVDVILLEIILSAAQLLPNHLDSVDHVAHVVGFFSGMGLATLLRAIQRWPTFLQTRGEFIYWSVMERPKVFDPVHTPFYKWLEILEINSYNDRIKLKLYQIVYKHHEDLSEMQIEQAFKFMTPTFVRLQTPAVAACLRELMEHDRRLPENWFAQMPYDAIIKIAKYLAEPPEAQPLLFKFVSDYRKAHPEGGDLERKLELLMRKLSGFMASQAAASSSSSQESSAGSLGTATEDNSLPKERPRSSQKKAKGGF